MNYILEIENYVRMSAVVKEYIYICRSAHFSYDIKTSSFD